MKNTLKQTDTKPWWGIYLNPHRLSAHILTYYLGHFISNVRIPWEPRGTGHRTHFEGSLYCGRINNNGIDKCFSAQPFMTA